MSFLSGENLLEG